MKTCNALSSAIVNAGSNANQTTQTQPPEALFDFPAIFDNSLDEKGLGFKFKELGTFQAGISLATDSSELPNIAKKAHVTQFEKPDENNDKR